MGKPKEQQQAPQGEPSESKVRGKALWAAAKAAIDGQINGDRNHGWGQADSKAAIEAVVNEDAALSKCGDVTKFTLSDEALLIIDRFINPSACRQWLEDAKGMNRLNKSDRKRTSVDFEAEFGE